MEDLSLTLGMVRLYMRLQIYIMLFWPKIKTWKQRINGMILKHRSLKNNVITRGRREKQILKCLEGRRT